MMNLNVLLVKQKLKIAHRVVKQNKASIAQGQSVSFTRRGSAVRNRVDVPNRNNICQCMKQQLEHHKVILKIVCMHRPYKKLKSFLNNDMDHVMYHIYHMLFQVNAGVAQLVEHYLAKVNVESSSLFARSKEF